MAQVYLSIGSNEEREQNIQSCLDALETNFGRLVISKVYESEAVGFDGESFYNLVVGIETERSVGDLSQVLKRIEDDHGRVRVGPKFSGRTLDIDILTYDQQQGVIDGVSLPRDEITYHAFVLLPLSELAGDSLHPELDIPYVELWQDFSQTDKCRNQALWPVNFTWQNRVISRSAI